MGKQIKYDFSGYATKNGLKCSDGRTILRDAFQHQDGATVPLVWQHMHDDPSNVLGHAVLENRQEGVYCYGKFNETEKGQNAKELVSHGDILGLSIYANQLKERARNVMHGNIREVSLVLSPANPGAHIENVSFAHSDGSVSVDDEEAIIYGGQWLAHKDDGKGKKDDDDDDDERTIADVFDTLNEEQKTVVYALIAQALEGEDGQKVKHSDDDTIQDVYDSLTDTQKDVVHYLIGAAIDGDGLSDDISHSGLFLNNGGENNMKKNVFDQNGQSSDNVLTHEMANEIISNSKKYGSIKESFLAHAEDYGFDPIDVLFPEARTVGAIQTLKRDDTWVDVLLGSATKTPFSRIKTVTADITADEARAKGYITGTKKVEEIIPLLRRTTSPTTIYKKQKLDRDDIVDIIDFDVVAWLKAEMRQQLNEELARAVLIGDRRGVAEEDKINEQCIRPIALDDDLYVHRETLPVNTPVDELIDEFIRARKHYKGSGSPTLFIGTDMLTEMLLVKDTMGRRLYNNLQELASVLRVKEIVEVEAMNNVTRTEGDASIATVGIVVNMKDYTIGADKGGQVSMFDDFDIDWNQQKYLIETRVSGALTKPKSAIVIETTTDTE